jgi:hypothetical protein
MAEAAVRNFIAKYEEGVKTRDVKQITGAVSEFSNALKGRELQDELILYFAHHREEQDKVRDYTLCVYEMSKAVT